MSPNTRIRVPVNTSLHVFQWRPFTLIRVLCVLYGLAVNFTRTSSFCAGCVFIKAFTRFDFTGDCQQTRVELCACTSDRERSTRAGEACTSDRQPVNANPDSHSRLCELSLSLSRVLETQTTKNRLAALPSAAALTVVTCRQYSRPKTFYF